MRCVDAMGFALLLSSFGCEAKPAADPVESRRAPPAARWQRSALVLDDDAGSARFVISTGEGNELPMAVRGHFVGLPAETAVTLAGKTASAREGGELRLEADIRDRAGSLPLDEVLGGRTDLGLSLTVSLPGHRPLETELPSFELGPSVAALLGEVRRGIVSFPGEPAYAGAPRAIAALGPPSAKRELRMVGPAKQVWDIDWVAIEERLSAVREMPCRGYRRRVDVVLKMHDSTVEIYDRRLGDVVRTRSFRAPSECPREPLLSPDGSTHAFVARSEIDRWLRAELGI